MWKLRRKPRKTVVRKNPPAPAERLEPRLLLSSTRIAESQAQFSTGLDGAASDGMYAYYYSLDVGGAEILQTDGSTAGTRKIATLADVDYIPDFRVIGGELFFWGRKLGGATAHVYAAPADGSAVADVGEFAHPLSQLADVDGKAYFLAGRTENELGIWTSDGTVEGTRLVHAFDGPAASTGTNFNVASIGGDLYIALLKPGGGWSIQRYDPTADDLRLLLDDTGRQPLAYLPTFAAAGNHVIFDVAPALYQGELWSTDGTAAGTQSLQQSNVSELQSGVEYAYFKAGGRQSRTDGTIPGTAPIYDNSFGGPSVVLNGIVFTSGSYQRGIYRVEGDHSTQIFDGQLQSLIPAGDRLFFIAGYPRGLGDLDHAIGVTDGTAAGTRLIDAGDFLTQGLQPVAHGVVFSAFGGLREIDADAPELPSVSGDFFGDWNGDGVRQADESVRPWARLRHTEQADYDGHFKFRWVAPGKVDLNVEPTVDFVHPTTPLTRTLVVEEGHDIVGVDFGFKPFYSIRGYVETSNNDVLTGPGVEGQTVFVDLDRDGALDPDEPFSVSRSDGFYEFTDLPIGDLLLRIKPTEGWYATLPRAEGVFINTQPMNGRVFQSQDFGVSRTLPSNVVSVKMFEDLDRDGQIDAGEATLFLATAWADLDNDGVRDADEPSGVGGPQADALLLLPKPGTYTLRAEYESRFGWAMTTPPPTITLGPGERLFGLPIGLDAAAPSGATIAGAVFFDADRDGVFGVGDTWRNQARVYLDLDGDFAWRPNEPLALSDSLGRFTFNNLAPGHYSIRQDGLDGYYYQTSPAPGAAYEIDLGAGDQRLDLSFGYRDLPPNARRTIHGSVYDDVNGNGVHDAGEGPFHPVYPSETLQFFIDNDNDGTIRNSPFGENNPQVSADSNGLFDFMYVLPGKQRIRMGDMRSKYLVSGLGADGSLVVDVPLDGDRAVEFGVHRPNAVVSDARAMVNDESHIVIRADVSGFYNPDAIRQAARVVAQDGSTTTPIRSIAFNQNHLGRTTMVVELAEPSPPQGRYALTIPGTALLGTPSLPPAEDFSFSFDFPLPALATIAGRYVFYNDSPRDRNTPFDSSSDDNAIATDKTALLPGETATYANITNYTKGVNGVMIDVAGMPRDTAVARSDVLVRVGAAGDPSTWRVMPAAVSTRYGAGVGGSTRVTLIWSAGQNVNTWVQVTLKATNHTGLAAPDTFYVGNLVGDTGDSTGDFSVAADDLVRVRNAVGGAAGADNAFDIDRNGVVNAADLVLTRNAVGHSLVGLPAAPAGSVGRIMRPAPVFAGDFRIYASGDGHRLKDDAPSLLVRENVEVQ